MNSKPMSVLLIEDDETQCNNFKDYIDTRDDVKLIGITNSSTDGIELVKTHIPEGIILDIELHKGQGSGIDFLNGVKQYFNKFKPIILVTTNSASNILYNNLHTEGVDLIFYKNQTDYCPKLVISALVSLRKSLYKFNDLDNNSEILIETPANKDKKLSNKINAELDLVGISSHLKGRTYIHDAILYLLKEQPSDTVFNYLSNLYKKSSSSISRVMQTAINYAWRISSPDDLELHYTAKINYQTGVPTPTELIFYYVNKIKRII